MTDSKIFDNMGGMAQLHYLPFPNLESIDPPAEGLVLNIDRVPGTNWKKIPFVLESIKFKEPKKDTSDGNVYKPTLELFVLCDDFEGSDLANCIETCKLMLIVGDHEQRLTLLGTEDGGLKGISDYNSGEKVEDRKGYWLKFTGSFPQKSVKVSEGVLNDS
ncbi:hypothetical protein DF185_19850 [Marinifilum breve]|uniref:Uncharacterized protein n=1 Tax=Marinifilum breve TaxID=2184082 RepID=A0A2V3ZWF0_9BACT|nr:hypothetical protein [Marinifilum breve]PXX96896.1 hypothetical protein DF185_19850 [Marinifilum breve]